MIVIELINEIYSVGLLGIVRRDTTTGEYIQKFLSPKEMKYSLIRISQGEIEKIKGPILIDREKIFLIHPALDAYLRGNSGKYNPCDIIQIGNSYKFDFNKIKSIIKGNGSVNISSSSITTKGDIKNKSRPSKRNHSILSKLFGRVHS